MIHEVNSVCESESEMLRPGNKTTLFGTEKIALYNEVYYKALCNCYFIFIFPKVLRNY